MKQNQMMALGFSMKHPSQGERKLERQTGLRITKAQLSSSLAQKNISDRTKE